MELLLIYLFIALFFSFICSFLEAGLLSTNQSFIASLKEEGKKYGNYLEDYKQNIDKPLTAILTLNTFAHTLGAAGVGSQALLLWGNEYITIVSLVITIIILYFSEIIPKTLGANYWKPTAFLISYSLRGLVFILYPFVFLSIYFTRFLKKSVKVSEITRQEFGMMTKMSEEEGILESDESQIIQNLLKFSEIKVKNIMTPRPVIFSIDQNYIIQDFFREKYIRTFSRIPIYKENPENIIGYVIKEDLLDDLILHKGINSLSKYKREISHIHEDTPLPEVYEQFIKNREHIAIVVDDYHGLSGLLSMEDVIETLLGVEIIDELDSVDDLQNYARKNWEKRAKRIGLINDENKDKL